jgi:hypothetical protein
VKRRPEGTRERPEVALEERFTTRTVGAAALGRTCVEGLLATRREGESLARGSRRIPWSNERRVWTGETISQKHSRSP